MSLQVVKHNVFASSSGCLLIQYWIYKYLLKCSETHDAYLFSVKTGTKDRSRQDELVEKTCFTIETRRRWLSTVHHITEQEMRCILVIWLHADVIHCISSYFIFVACSFSSDFRHSCTFGCLTCLVFVTMLNTTNCWLSMTTERWGVSGSRRRLSDAHEATAFDNELQCRGNPRFLRNVGCAHSTLPDKGRGHIWRFFAIPMEAGDATLDFLASDLLSVRAKSLAYVLSNFYVQYAWLRNVEIWQRFQCQGSF